MNSHRRNTKRKYDMTCLVWSKKNDEFHLLSSRADVHSTNNDEDVPATNVDSIDIIDLKL